jgi:DNA replication protein DnaC
VITDTTPPPLPPDIEQMTRRMRLPHLRRCGPEVLAVAKAQRWEPAEIIRVLLTEEIKGRDLANRAARRRQAGLPSTKTFDSWIETDSSIPVGTQRGLASLEWVGRGENLVICGTSGTGKTHFAQALALTAIDQGMRVVWHTLETLTDQLNAAGADGTARRTVAKIIGSDLIVIDDIGMLPADQAAAEAFYRVVDGAYEKRSIIVTSNIHPSGFDAIMPKTLATAAVDRLLHHAHVVITEGESHRFAQATAGKGVQALNN